jgi:uncharacterized OsmC-like protein
VKIVLESDESILLLPADGQLTIEAESADVQFSPFQMLASSLATCTFAVLQSWATQAELNVDNLSVRVGWTFVDNPHRAGEVRVDLLWPDLPPERTSAAKRVAELCAVHKTLTNSPSVGITVNNT